jgi:signal transduction histidine kinase
MPLSSEPVELGELAGTIAAEMVAAANAAEVALEVHAPAPAWALADPRAVARVMRIFLENALRHGAVPDTTVTIAVDVVDERARVRVTDAGPGVPEADRERIFGRFERGATTGSGFGLGLAIARGLARQMHGDVRVCPDAARSCFEAVLPACAAPSDGAMPSEEEPEQELAVATGAQSSGQS